LLPLLHFVCHQTGEIKALAGVDFLTISPSLLEELKSSTEAVPKKLDAAAGAYSLEIAQYIVSRRARLA